MSTPSERSDAKRSGKTFSAVLLGEVVDYRSIAEPLLPVSEASVVQTSPGPEPSNLEIFSSGTVSVLGLEHSASSVGIVVLNPDCYGFMWWDGSEDCRINGEPVRRTLLFAQGAQDGFHAAGGKRRTMGAAVRRDDFVETVAALQGIDPEDIRLRRTALELPPEAATRLRTGIELASRQARKAGPESSSEASSTIIGLLVDAYLCSPTEPPRKTRARPPEEIVRKAEERFFEADGGPISLADLCAAAGVSQSALYRAFYSICDEPPLAYFQKRRLTDARRALLRSSEYRGAIKHAAMSVGLTEMGRFSVEYRRLFGESPSATLNRTARL